MVAEFRSKSVDDFNKWLHEEGYMIIILKKSSKVRLYL